MVPEADGLGAIPKLLHAQLEGLSERHEVCLVGSYGDLPGQAEAAEALSAGGRDVHFVDRRRSRSLRRRWLVRAELAGRWLGDDLPWRVVSLSGGVQPALDRAVASGPFDVIALEHSSAASLRLPSGTPIVLTEHEAERSVPLHSGTGGRAGDAVRRRDWRRWERYQPRAWGRADLVQVYSGGDAAAVAARAPALAGRIRVNPFGISIPRRLDPASERPGRVLFTGTFAHPPNLDSARWLATEILPALQAAEPAAELEIVGTKPPAEIQAMARPGLRVVADAASLEPHLAAAAVVLAPVRLGGGMRMKVLEAMAAGKAVVTTPLGAEGIADLPQAPPLLVADGTEELARAAAELLADPVRRAELGRQARDFAERLFSPAAWAARLQEVYEEASSLRGSRMHE
jgi:glycosyltransferase involved in cell wall biosynthesis